MTATLDPRTDDGVEDVEDNSESQTDVVADVTEEAGEGDRPSVRLAVAVAFPTLAAAVMVGGIFRGASPRVYTAVAGLLGVALAYGVSRIRNRPLLSNALAFAGLFGIGLVVLAPNFGAAANLRAVVGEAVDQGNLLRPPVDFLTGWKPVVGWLMGIVGFTAAWVATALRKPALALLLPLPVAAFAGISVPDNAQVASGIVVLVLFAISLGILSSEQATAGDDEGTSPPLSYELRKAVKSLPLLAVITVGLYFLAQTNFLFPDPVIDPAQEPQRPRTQPLSEVEDRVLFEVDSDLSGPWRIGSLDVYDGKDWRLPPFAQSELEEVDESGVVDNDLGAAVEATFTINGLGGAVLPVLPNTVGVIAEGPRLSYDARNGNIRLVSGQVNPGFSYTVAAAGIPSVDDLKVVNKSLPKSIVPFTEIPDPPAGVRDLIAEAPVGSAWERFDFLRTWVLENVTASGTGTPVSITPERVEEIVSIDKKATPFEIVATQAMLARWIGVPSRIGYGFDGGDVIDGKRQIRPSNGAAFVEVYFPGFKWLPVIGTPKKAEPTVGGDPSTQRVDPGILPSDDIAVQLFMPTVVPPRSVLAKQIGVIVLLVVSAVLLLLALYTAYPAVRKAVRRGRRRKWALAAGTRARVAVAYSEWRDYATDLGFLYGSDTPLMYLDRFVDDEEHNELAWLATRVMWGDLQADADPMLATVAEELSRSLRRRLGAAQPSTVRAVAAISRLSLRHPYAPEIDARHAEDRATSSRKERPYEVAPA